MAGPVDARSVLRIGVARPDQLWSIRMASNVVSTAEMDAAERAAPLDALLVDAALGPLRRFTPDASTARWVARLARHPRTTGRRFPESS
jgi:hypothetical protein